MRDLIRDVTYTQTSVIQCNELERNKNKNCDITKPVRINPTAFLRSLRKKI